MKPLVHIKWTEDDYGRWEAVVKGILAHSYRDVESPTVPFLGNSWRLERSSAGTWAMRSAMSGHIGLVSDSCLQIDEVKTSLVVLNKEWEELLLHWDQSVPSVCWGHNECLFSKEQMQATPKRESQQRVTLDSVKWGLVQVNSSW